MFGKREKLIIAVIIFCCVLSLSFSITTFAQNDKEAQKASATWTDWGERVFIPLLQLLIWPVVIIVALYGFKDQIKGLIKRTEKLEMEIAGAKVTITGDNPEETEKLAKTVSEAMTGSVADTHDFIEQAKKKGEKVEIIGKPDEFQLLCKVTSKNLKKSTKVMNVPTGCIVQITTKEVSPNGQFVVAEAVTFVPDLNVEIKKDKADKIVKAEFVKIA